MARHAARIDMSRRLQRVLGVLMKGGWHSTFDITKEAQTPAAGAAISEINAAVNKKYLNTRGIEKVLCRRRPTDRTVFEYRLIPKKPEPRLTGGRAHTLRDAAPIPLDLPGMPADLTG